MKLTNKIISVLLVCTVLLFSLGVYPFAEEGDPLKGDMDLSGKIEVSDARVILRMAANLHTPTDDEMLLADMNGDGIVSVKDAVLALREASNIGGVIIPGKSGDNELSDDPSNYFIQLIATTYNHDPASLVAIYSVPDDGTNYVLCFGKTLGGYKKSVDNLTYVYHIGKAPERKISYTNGGLINVNCTSYEGLMTFNIVKTMVMPEYPGYFEGV